MGGVLLNKTANPLDDIRGLSSITYIMCVRNLSPDTCGYVNRLVIGLCAIDMNNANLRTRRICFWTFLYVGFSFEPKAAKPVWAKQLTRLPCLVVYAKFQFVYTTESKMGSQLLLASTSSHVQL